MFSAYLTIYNDWDFLVPALRSIAPYVDELLVVDGAYEWQAPYLSALGHDLLRSDQRVYDAIESAGIPYRVVSQLWASQVEKRIAGYSACTGRFVCRIDADEVMFFDDPALERFQSRGGAVAQVEMPTYVAPGWVEAPKSATTALRRVLGAIRRRGRLSFPRQCFLFDRTKIEPDIHLNYLWIVRDADKLARHRGKPFAVHRQPVGFNAHLTNWRTFPTATYRAESYTLHNLLRGGVPWLLQLRGRPLESLEPLLDIVPAAIFRETIEASRFSAKGMLKGEVALTRTPLSPVQEAVFAGHFGQLLAGFAALNRRKTQTVQHFLRGQPLLVDVSNAACADAVAPDGLMLVEFGRGVMSASVELHTIEPHAPWQTTSILEHRHEGRFLVVRIPQPGCDGSRSLRRQIALRARIEGDGTIETFRIRTERPLPFEAFE